MTRNEQNKIIMQAEAISELRRLDQMSCSVPQQMSLRLSSMPASIGDGGFITLTDNYPHCHWLESAANMAFRINLQKAIKQYREILEKVSETGEYP